MNEPLKLDLTKHIQSILDGLYDVNVTVDRTNVLVVQTFEHLVPYMFLSYLEKYMLLSDDYKRNPDELLSELISVAIERTIAYVLEVDIATEDIEASLLDGDSLHTLDLGKTLYIMCRKVDSKLYHNVFNYIGETLSKIDNLYGTEVKLIFKSKYDNEWDAEVITILGSMDKMVLLSFSNEYTLFITTLKNVLGDEYCHKYMDAIDNTFEILIQFVFAHNANADVAVDMKALKEFMITASVHMADYEDALAFVNTIYDATGTLIEYIMCNVYSNLTTAIEPYYNLNSDIEVNFTMDSISKNALDKNMGTIYIYKVLANMTILE